MNCSMKPPVNITLGGNEDTPCRAYGCKIFDITFPNILCPEVTLCRYIFVMPKGSDYIDDNLD